MWSQTIFGHIKIFNSLLNQKFQADVHFKLFLLSTCKQQSLIIFSPSLTVPHNGGEKKGHFLGIADITILETIQT